MVSSLLVRIEPTSLAYHMPTLKFTRNYKMVRSCQIIVKTVYGVILTWLGVCYIICSMDIDKEHMYGEFVSLLDAHLWNE